MMAIYRHSSRACAHMRSRSGAEVEALTPIVLVRFVLTPPPTASWSRSSSPVTRNPHPCWGCCWLQGWLEHLVETLASCTPSIKLSTKNLRCLSSATATENNVTSLDKVFCFACWHFGLTTWAHYDPEFAEQGVAKSTGEISKDSVGRIEGGYESNWCPSWSAEKKAERSKGKSTIFGNNCRRLTLPG